jgi:hypothetical protein
MVAKRGSAKLVRPEKGAAASGATLLSMNAPIRASMLQIIPGRYIISSLITA